MKHVLTFMMLALLGASGALAQIAVKIVPEKKTFLTGEANYMRLTVTNNSGTPVELKSREYSSWLDIHVEHTTGGAMLPQSRFAVFPPLNVPAGMSVSRKIDLRHFYNLSREGNYHVQAVVKMPNEKDMVRLPKGSVFHPYGHAHVVPDGQHSGKCQKVQILRMHHSGAGHPEAVHPDQGSGDGCGV